MILPAPTLSCPSSMYRTFPLFLFAACGVFGLSTEEADQLASYKEQAQTYWDGGDVSRAIAQSRKGLTIDPNDYKLLTIQAWCVLRVSGNDEATLQEAQTLFEDLMDQRSMSQHSGQALLGYGLCLEQVGRLQRQQVELLETRLQHQALDAMERSEVEAMASEHEALAKSSFLKARGVLERLVENGEQLLLANKSLMSINSLLPDYARAVEHGKTYLVESLKAQDIWKADLALTPVVAYEQELRTRLGQLRQEEIEVRALLANIYYQMQQWDRVVEQLDIVLDLDRTRSIDYYNRGNSLLKLGRDAEATADFKTFLSITNLPPGDPRVVDAVQSSKGILDP